MSKPSYAAVASSNSKQPATATEHDQSGAGPSDAPPPYTEPQSHPHQTILPPAHSQIQGYHVESGLIHPGANSWTPPTEAVAKSRALRRFWVAFFWAWVIWVLVGLIVGGGVSDVEQNPVGRHGHWDKNGNWHTDNLQ